MLEFQASRMRFTTGSTTSLTLTLGLELNHIRVWHFSTLILVPVVDFPFDCSTLNQMSQYDMLTGNSCPSNSMRKFCAKGIYFAEMVDCYQSSKKWFRERQIHFFYSCFSFRINHFLWKQVEALKIACSWKHAQIIIRLITFSEYSVSEVFSVEESNVYTRFSANWTHDTCININF